MCRRLSKSPSINNVSGHKQRAGASIPKNQNRFGSEIVDPSIRSAQVRNSPARRPAVDRYLIAHQPPLNTITQQPHRGIHCIMSMILTQNFTLSTAETTYKDCTIPTTTATTAATPTPAAAALARLLPWLLAWRFGISTVLVGRAAVVLVDGVIRSVEEVFMLSDGMGMITTEDDEDAEGCWF